MSDELCHTIDPAVNRDGDGAVSRCGVDLSDEEWCTPPCTHEACQACADALDGGAR